MAWEYCVGFHRKGLEGFITYYDEYIFEDLKKAMAYQDECYKEDYFEGDLSRFYRIYTRLEGEENWEIFL